MKKNYFKNVAELAVYLIENGSFTFKSKQKKLTQWKVLMMCLASGDFNPAHCQPEFAEHSIFGTAVSHGIGTLARAEAEFLQEMQFDVPVEVIALGLESKYKAALPVGSVYYYTYTISNLVSKKNRWDMDCQIQCTIINKDGSEKVIVNEMWYPSFVDHSDRVPVEKLELLRPKSYLANVLNIFVARPANAVAVSFIWGIGIINFLGIAFFIGSVFLTTLFGAPSLIKEDIFAYCF